MYIEKDTCDCACPNCNDTVIDYNNDSEENMNRWKYVVGDWGTMSFKDKISLFIPMIKYIKDSSYKTEEISNAYSDIVADVVFKSCRSIKKISFELDRYSVPTVLVTLDGINPEMIPFPEIRSSAVAFRNKYMSKASI